jgi:hypothetical protein
MEIYLITTLLKYLCEEMGRIDLICNEITCLLQIDFRGISGDETSRKLWKLNHSL